MPQQTCGARGRRCLIGDDGARRHTPWRRQAKSPERFPPCSGARVSGAPVASMALVPWTVLVSSTVLSRQRSLSRRRSVPGGRAGRAFCGSTGRPARFALGQTFDERQFEFDALPPLEAARHRELPGAAAQIVFAVIFVSRRGTGFVHDCGLDARRGCEISCIIFATSRGAHFCKPYPILRPSGCN